MLEFEAPNNTTGSNMIVSGTLRSDVAAGLPFGTGAIQLQAATLQLTPVERHGGHQPDRRQRRRQPVDVSIWRHAGPEPQRQQFAETLTIGGNTNGTTANLVRSPGPPGHW